MASFSLSPRTACFLDLLRREVIRKSSKSDQRRRAIALATLHVSLQAIASETVQTFTHSPRCVFPRPRFRPQPHMDSLSNSMFTRLYRVPKPQYMKLLQQLIPALHRKQKNYSNVASSLQPSVMLFVTLRILAGASYLDVSWPYGIGCSTVYEAFTETLIALDQTLPKIRFPSTFDECRKSSELFKTLQKSPLDGIVAALDGLAVEIRRPCLKEAPDPMKYYNRKKFFAVCVQAAVTADYKFVFVSARHSGGTHDATAFSNTELYKLLQGEKLPSWAPVVADDAYSNKKRVLTPYPGRSLSIRQDTYNAYHSITRACVEQAFGILICRFGIFWSDIRYPLWKTTLIILVACKLHTFLIDHSHNHLYEFIPQHDNNHVSGSPSVQFQDALHTERDNMRGRNRSRESSTLRDELADKLQRLGFMRKKLR